MSGWSWSYMWAACVREGTTPLTIAPYVGAGSGLCRACFWLLGALICNYAALLRGCTLRTTYCYPE